MPTLKEYRRAMLDLWPELGRVVPVSSLTTTTAVSSQLAVGSLSSEAYTNRWLVRADAAASADRVRLISAYTASSGTLTHAGASYSDTTATNENAELLKYEPWLYDAAIQEAIGKLRYVDRAVLPWIQNQRRYYLGDLAWVDQPNRVVKVAWTQSPVVSRDRFIEKWNTVNTSGVLQPDLWTLAGSGATAARSTTQNRRSRYSTALVRSGTNATLTQTCSLLLNGTDNDEDLRGKTVRVVGLGWASAASQLRFQIGDGTQTVSTSYHTGGSSWEELSTTIDIAAAATTLTIAASVETTNGTVYVDECYAVPDANWGDAVRRDAYPETTLARGDYRFEQAAGEVAILLPGYPRGGQWVFFTSRAYPKFDATRLAAGTADADAMDAPLVPVACGAIAELLEGMVGREGVDDTRIASLAAFWGRRAAKEAAKHFGTEETPRGGVDLPRALLAPAARGY